MSHTSTTERTILKPARSLRCQHLGIEAGWRRTTRRSER
jgi:hypothetical protein